MKNIFKSLVLGLVLTISTAQAFEKIDLPSGRTSMEYSAQVRSFINSVENFKWEAANGEGFHFVQAEKPYKDDFVSKNMYLTTNSFFYGKPTAERLMYVVQSKYMGYLDLIDHETGVVIPIRYLPNGTIETIKTSGKTMIFSKVSKWADNPNPIKSKGSPRDRGLIY